MSPEPDSLEDPEPDKPILDSSILDSPIPDSVTPNSSTLNSGILRSLKDFEFDGYNGLGTTNNPNCIGKHYESRTVDTFDNCYSR